MKGMVLHLKALTQLRFRKIHYFEPRFHFEFHSGDYRVKTATSRQDLLEAFRLRYQVFQPHKKFHEGLDVDKFDHNFDHILIFSESQRMLVGTYRVCLHDEREILNTYTGKEFDLTPLNEWKGKFLELGRACIHPDFRKGSVMALLWRGIAEYQKMAQAKYLFGCTSLKIQTAREAALVFKFLDSLGVVEWDHLCSAKSSYRFPDFESWFAFYSRGLLEDQEAEAHSFIPPLLKSYLKLGAKVASEPAWDRAFQCVDFLTILDLERLKPSVADRYRVARPQKAERLSASQENCYSSCVAKVSPL